MQTLPNHLKAANSILPIKSTTIRRLDTSLVAQWIDTSRFELAIPPRTTVDLSGMAGAFWNGHNSYNCRVVAVNANFIDTLIEGRWEFRHEKFHYKAIWFMKAAYWYDTKNIAIP